MNTERVILLISKYQKDQLTSAEASELDLLIENDPEGVVIMDALSRMMEDAAPAVEFDTKHWKHLAQRVLETDKKEINESNANAPVHRVHLLKTGWFRYAAILLLIAGTATFLYLFSSSLKNDSLIAEIPKPNQQDIAPGGEKALLTLSDGTTIVLDSAGNGTIAQQGNAQVIKLSNGQIAYNLKGASNKEAMWNTMTTPRGGQYRVVLPDGTNVWLNAASSITYPAVFVGTERKVKVSGEVYFEVAKHKEKPFIVDIDGKSLVQVLGTSFNINSYSDEPSIKTTLLEGSVRVTKVDTKSSALLRPGQEAGIANNAAKEGITVVSNADVKKVLAWKNGLFNFNNADLPTVAKQLEKWYDINVTFEGTVPDVQIIGEMKRGVKLSTILKWFSDLGINTRLEGKNLIIL